MVTIHIHNCRNIKELSFDIPLNRKTIILANNGTGKSTIVKSIENNILNLEKHDLQSFDKSITNKPISCISKEFSKIMIFDNNYTNNIIFKDSSLLQGEGTYEILYEDEDVQENKKKIEELLSDFIQDFTKIISPIEQSLEDFSKIFSKSQSKNAVPRKNFDGLSSANPLIKISNDNLFHRIINNVENKSEWVTWREKQQILNIDNEEICPYCAQKIALQNIDDIKHLDLILDSKAVESRQKTADLISSLKLITTFNFDTFDKVINGGSSIESTTINSNIHKIFKQNQEMINTIKVIKNLSAAKIYDLDTPLDLGKIDIKVFNKLADYNIIRRSYEKLKKQKSLLDKYVSMSNSKLNLILNKNCQALNDFTKTTGIPYIFNKEQKNNRNHLIMKYIGSEDEIQDPANYLSYGEKNALASVLFGIIAKNSKTDFIVFDDPFSSFDEFKTHYVYKFLFKGRKALLKGKTVLFLTHSESIVHDLVYHRVPIEFDKCLVLSKKNDSHSIIQLKKANIKKYTHEIINRVNDSENEIVKMVYIRKLVELTSSIHKNGRDKNYYDCYQYLSSYIKGGNLSYKLSNSEFISMTEEEKNVCKINLNKFCSKHNISHFSQHYNKLNFAQVIEEYKHLKDIESKLIFFRYLVKRDQLENKVLKLDDLSIAFFLDYSNHFEKDLMLLTPPNIYSKIPPHVEKLIDDYYEILVNGY